MKVIFWFFFALSFINSHAQHNYTLAGKITDEETGEDLIGASVFVEELKTGGVTNRYGFYSITLPHGEYTVRYSYMGYEEVAKKLSINKNITENIALPSALIDLEEVTISAQGDDKNVRSVSLGMERIPLKQIQGLPVLFGEKDLLKTIQLLPGITNPSEGSTGFSVRGGSLGANLILLDEAPVYSASHLMGFFSVFNSDAINDVTIYKGGIPAEFGGRASSVLDISMNNGNNKSFHCTGGIGLVSSRLMVEGPVIKNKMSYLISGRRTYADLVAKALLPDDLITDDMNFFFYDLNTKLNYTLNDHNRLFVSGYFGRDIFELEDNIGTWWGNTTGTLRWNHVFGNRFFTNTSVIYSKYDYGFLFGQTGIRLRSGIEDINFQEDATWYINPDNTFKTGFEMITHRFLPGEVLMTDSTDYNVGLEEKQALEGAVYVQNQQNIGSRLRINYGIRLSAFSQLGPTWLYEYNEEGDAVDSSSFSSGELVHPVLNVEPRLIITFITGEKSSIKLAYNRMTQYIHLLSNSAAGFPSDIWMPASNSLEPLKVDHFSMGFFRNFSDNKFETSIEGYYKNKKNTLDYKDGANIVFNRHSESTVLGGEGRSYGLEFYLKKKYGSLSGWISYTLSRTENRIPGISDNNWYPMKYDKTHDLSIVAMYRVSKRVTLSAVWVYATGNAVTFPSGRYVVDNNVIPYYTERNGYRMPPYHRLDISLTLDGKKRKRFESGWDFSFYNVYNRQNAYMIYFRESDTSPGSTEAVRLSLFGIVPSITWNFKF